MEWRWKNTIPLLINRIACYNKNLNPDTKEAFGKEFNSWIEEGILAPWHEQVASGVLPLIAVE